MVKQINSYDVGSLPLNGNLDKFCRGVSQSDSLLSLLYKSLPQMEYFEGMVLQAFVDKLRVGINIPNYPQFRDMSQMFLEKFDGIKKTEGGYVVTDRLYVRPESLHIPEVRVLNNNSSKIYEKTGGQFGLKVCVTGPHTLSQFFPYRDIRLIKELGQALSKIVERNIFNSKHGDVRIITVDEPVLGLVDDPLIDQGSVGREALLKSWETVLRPAKSRNNIRTSMHLHSTSDGLFWDVESLDVVESHVGDSLYTSKRAKQLLEEKDKFLKASICITDFDKLIIEKIKRIEDLDEVKLNEQVAVVWNDLRKDTIDPRSFLENAGVMEKRIRSTIEFFGEERVPYAGPECGMKGFPSYNCAIEYLKRVTEAVDTSLKN